MRVSALTGLDLSDWQDQNYREPMDSSAVELVAVASRG
jgi:hypothetical protein